ncbi:MAG: putative holin-like toxin [Eubacteriales bacterium]
MNTYETLSILIGFGMLIISLVSLVIAINKAMKKGKK